MIRIEHLSIDLGEFHLHDVDLSIEQGEYLVLLGPTGVGKTVLVECIVGIHRPRTGRILIDGEDVTGLNPEERNVGYVPQDYALFPNMTVARNLAYGLEARGYPAARITKEVQSMMDVLNIGYLQSRLPLNLSGGEKQRVALGRALITGPRILLLDEPLSALDENMRSELAAELRRVHDAVQGTFLHVCHNFDEAASVADRAAIMNGGTMAQVGTIDDLLYRPAGEFVARFTRTRNVFHGLAERDGSGSTVTINDRVRLYSGQAVTGQVVLAVRPGHVRIVGPEKPATRNVLSGRVARCAVGVTHEELEVDIGVMLVVLLDRTRGEKTFNVGQAIQLYIPSEMVYLIPARA